MPLQTRSARAEWTSKTSFSSPKQSNGVTPSQRKVAQTENEDISIYDGYEGTPTRSSAREKTATRVVSTSRTVKTHSSKRNVTNSNEASIDDELNAYDDYGHTPTRSRTRVNGTTRAKQLSRAASHAQLNGNTPSKRKLADTIAGRVRADDEASIYDDFEGAHKSSGLASGTKRRKRGLDDEQGTETPSGTPSKRPRRGGLVSELEANQTMLQQTPTRRKATRAVSERHNRVRSMGSPESAPNGVVETPKKRSSVRGRAKRRTSDENEDEDDYERTKEDVEAQEQLEREAEVMADITSEIVTPKKPQTKSNSFTKALAKVASKILTPRRRLAEGELSKSHRTGPRPPDAIRVIDTPSGESRWITPQDEFESLQKILIERVTGRRPGPLVGLDEEYAKVHHLVSNTVSSGEGNSMLLIGARGSGKTAIVRKVLSSLKKEHAEDFYAIHLNGFIHTDDKIALKEIWRQLGREMEVDDDGKNYADTLLKLLALLSHPTESGTDDPEKVAKAVVFILDEFDLFASHPRQTLLYNLFDIAQSRKAPIAVLGLTTRIDVGESLEKRVKSRFSHRYVHTSLQKSLHAFLELCQTALTIETDDLTDEERVVLDPEAPGSESLVEVDEKSSYLAEWNSFIETLFADETFISNSVASHYHLNKSLSSFLSSVHPLLASLSSSSFPPSTASFRPTTLLAPPDSKLHIIHSLSSLALALLIAAARLDIITDTPTCNFNMAYSEYVGLASKARTAALASGQNAVGAGMRVWGRGVAKREWERLLCWEMIVPATGAAGGVASGSVGATAMMMCDVSLEEIGSLIKGMNDVERVVEGWCKSI